MNQAFILLANMAKNHVMYEKASRQFKLKGIIQGKLELAEYKIGSSCDLIADKERKFLKKTNQKLRENISVMLVNNEISRAFKNIDTFSREHHNAKRLPCIKTALEGAIVYDKYVDENNLEHTMNGVLHEEN